MQTANFHFPNHCIPKMELCIDIHTSLKAIFKEVSKDAQKHALAPLEIIAWGEKMVP